MPRMLTGNFIGKEVQIANKQETSLLVREMQFPEKMRTFSLLRCAKKIKRFISVGGKGVRKLHSQIVSMNYICSVNSTSFLVSILPISKL